MATRQRKVPPQVKTQLIEEAGRKCANPGCSNWRVHLHHIRQWSVYKSHDGKHMIAICPSCHDSVHHAGIDDETLYRWKRISRPATTEIVDHLYVEPSTTIKVLTGSIYVTTDRPDALVFNLSNNNHFGFRVEDDKIFLSHCLIRDLGGAVLVRAKSNHFRLIDSDRVGISRRTGRIRVTVHEADKYFPDWIGIMWRAVPEFTLNNEVAAFDIEVIEPGIVRLRGVFVAPDSVFAITDDKIWILKPEMNGPLAIVSQNRDACINVTGPITKTAFQL